MTQVFQRVTTSKVTLACQPMFSGCLFVDPVILDKIYLFSKNLHQNKYQSLLKDFAENINPEAGYEVIDAYSDEIIPLEELPVDNQKLLFLMILFVKATKTASLNIFTKGGTETAAFFTSLKTSTRRRKTSVITVPMFVLSDWIQEKTSGLHTS